MLFSKDVKLVKSMIDELEETYKAKTGMKIIINIDSDFNIPAQEICGILITAKNRTIIVENTLVARLLRLTQRAIPLITSGLFGPNPSRTGQEDPSVFL